MSRERKLTVKWCMSTWPGTIPCACEAKWHLKSPTIEMWVCDGHLVPTLLYATKPERTELGAIITDGVLVRPFIQAYSGPTQ